MITIAHCKGGKEITHEPSANNTGHRINHFKQSIPPHDMRYSHHKSDV
jgi:hypothetical protein